MNKEDIIRMAQECQLIGMRPHLDGIYQESLERFAALVAAAEREKVARWQIGSGYTTGYGNTIEDLLVELEWEVRESEREECAKVCSQMYLEGDMDTGSAAAAIRARGQE